MSAQQIDKLNPVLRYYRNQAPADLQTHPFRPAIVLDPQEPRAKVLLRVASGLDKDRLRSRYPRSQFGSQTGPVITAEMPFSDLDALQQDPGVETVEASMQLRPTLEVARSAATTSGVFLGVLVTGFLNFGTNLGQGVVVGVVDTGIDFRHKDFLTSSNQSRILFLWDQTDTGGPNPTSPPFSYGSEWTQAQLNSSIASPPGPVRQTDTDGHGTHVTGIAAGNGTDTSGLYTGFAPEADIIFVKTDFTTSRVIDGVSYIASKASSLGKKAVINLSLGGQFGPHDGTDSFETGIGNLAANTPVVVSMGNSQTAAGHASATVTVGSPVVIQVQRTASTSFFAVDFWVPSGDTYTCSVANDTSFTSAVTATHGNNVSGSLGSATVTVSNGTNIHPRGDKEIYITVQQGGGITQSNFYLRFVRTASGSTGKLDGYIIYESVTKFGDNVDLTGTVASPATASNVIAVGSYCSKRQWVASDGNTYESTECTPTLFGDISSFSSRGPTRDSRLKPDIAAPGQFIASAMSANTTPPLPASLRTQDGRHAFFNGTSMSAPIVAGIAALALQKNPSLTVSQVISTIRASNRSDAKVASAGSLPNNTWGYGKLRVVTCNNPPGSLTLCLGPGEAGTVSGTLSNASVSLAVPANSFEDATTISIAPQSTLRCGAINTAVSVTASPTAQPRLPLQLSVGFTPGQPGLGDYSTLGMARYDPAGNTCVPLFSRVDTSLNQVVAQTNHLSDFQLQQISPSGGLSGARVFPNPLYSSSQAFFTLDRVPANTRVRIFTLHGEEVFDEMSNSSGLVIWRATNKVGRPVGSGIYLAVLEAGGHSHTMKLAVVR